MGAAAIVVAAGRGERLGAGVPKALVSCHGRPLMAWALDVLLASPSVGPVVVALPDGAGTADVRDRVSVVAGGAERSHSVRAALAALGEGPEFVLVHDAARPLVTVELVEATLAACASGGVDAAIAAAPVTDTIKRVGADGVTVSETLDRSELRAVQTPQVFRRDVLERVLAAGDDVLAAATDDASLVEASGGRVVVVDAPAENLKVTTPVDLALAEMLLARRG